MPMSETVADSTSVADGAQQAADLIEAKILHNLEVFPFLSSSMIHMAIGTATSTMLWRPILMKLVAEGKVVKSDLSCRTPLDRTQSYTIYHLPRNEYKYGPQEVPSPANS